jgi:hypothetical protein
LKENLYRLPNIEEQQGQERGSLSLLSSEKQLSCAAQWEVDKAEASNVASGRNPNTASASEITSLCAHACSIHEIEAVEPI